MVDFKSLVESIHPPYVVYPQLSTGLVIISEIDVYIQFYSEAVSFAAWIKAECVEIDIGSHGGALDSSDVVGGGVECVGMQNGRRIVHVEAHLELVFILEFSSKVDVAVAVSAEIEFFYFGRDFSGWFSAVTAIAFYVACDMAKLVVAGELSEIQVLERCVAAHMEYFRGRYTIVCT